MHKRPYQTKPPYGNCVMQSPQGLTLCRCDLKKANWYLTRNLAKVIATDPLTIQLTFEPKGDGQSKYPYYIMPKANRCVCCGKEERLTKHHCVPRCFRQHFPDELKNHCCHDIVLCCVECHNQYELQAEKFKIEIAREYRVPRHLPLSEEQADLDCALRFIKTLERHRAKMPVERIHELENRIVEIVGKTNVSIEELKCRVQECRKLQSDDDSFGRHIVSQLTDIPAFIRSWRLHFVTVMKPRYLPDFWSIDHQASNPPKLLNLPSASVAKMQL